jgi:TetR/AcrR family transcriptional regulator, regulator of autoinduction and epiphytic fitness
VDGRAARGARNRQAVIDAMLSLCAEGELRPTAQAIAERAGVATRSVFHHFSDLESLLADAADTQARRHWDLLQAVDASDPIDRRIADVVSQRAELFERISPTRRAAVLQEHDSATLAERLRESRVALRLHLDRNLPELTEQHQEALAAAASWEAWEVLRRHQGLSVDAARRAVVQLFSAVLVPTATARR